MPFMLRKKLADIDRRGGKRDDFINEKIVEALESLPNPIEILPIKTKDPPILKADPNNFLVLYVVKNTVLNWCDVEHWLDIVSAKDLQRFQLEKTGIGFSNVDERKMCYWRDGYVRSSIIYTP